MPRILPFKAVFYNPEKIKDVSKIVAPPYDVISPGMQGKLYRQSPYNVVRLILGKIKKTDSERDNRYMRAGKFFDKCLKEHILVTTDRKALYIYSQKYKMGGRIIDRIGFIGLLGMDGKEGNVLPHENTLLKPKLDRLELMRCVKANLSPIFVLYDDARHKVADILRGYSRSHKPVIDIESGDVRHRVWKLDDERLIRLIGGYMRSKDIFIADGHHRFEVARTYSEEIRNSALAERIKTDSRSIMVYFVEADEGMLTVLPAHRLVKDLGKLDSDTVVSRLGESFCLEKAPTLKALLAKLKKHRSSNVFGMHIADKFYFLKLKSREASDSVMGKKSEAWRSLDVSILHLFIFKHVLGIRDEDDNIEYVKDAREAAELVDKGKFGIAFFLNPTKVSQVKGVARLGERMPKKATYFYPKPLSGLVINKFGS